MLNYDHFHNLFADEPSKDAVYDNQKLPLQELVPEEPGTKETKSTRVWSDADTVTLLESWLESMAHIGPGKGMKYRNKLLWETDIAKTIGNVTAAQVKSKYAHLNSNPQPKRHISIN